MLFRSCPVCRAGIEPSYLVCPVCTTQLKTPCGRCSAPLEPLWQACPYCAAPVRSRLELAEADLDSALAAEASTWDNGTSRARRVGAS